jgi:hypothetical protein
MRTRRQVRGKSEGAIQIAKMSSSTVVMIGARSKRQPDPAARYDHAGEVDVLERRSANKLTRMIPPISHGTIVI